MAKTVLKMNESQRKFAENNHGLIFSFLKRYGLSYEDYYGAVAYGFCKAVIGYKQDTSYRFGNYAYKVMMNTYINFKRNTKNDIQASNEYAVISANQLLTFNNNEEVEIIDTFSSLSNTEAEGTGNVFAESFVEQLTISGLKILYYRLLGYNHSQIACKLGVTHSRVSEIIRGWGRAVSQDKIPVRKNKNRDSLEEKNYWKSKVLKELKIKG